MLSCKKLLLKTTILLLLFTCWLGLNANTLILTNDTISEAVRLFETEDYTNAIPLFEKIVKEEPDNALMNYYYGASLAETNIFNDETNNSLLKAVSGNTPDKVLYYVGLLFKNKELWSSAIKYFNLFKSVSTFEEIDRLKVDEHIEECMEKGGSVKTIDVADSLQIEKNYPDSLPISEDFPLEVTKITIEENISSTKPEIKEVKTPQPKTIPIDFQVNTDIGYTRIEHFKTQEAKDQYLDGMKLSNKLDSLLQLSDSLRIVYENAKSLNERDMVAGQIVNLEQETMELKSKSDTYFMDARQMEASYWNSASQSEIDSFQNVLEKLSQIENPNPETETMLADTSLDFNASIYFSDPQIEPESKETTDELIYRIQIGAYSRGLPAYMDRLYKKLSVIRKIENYTDDKGIVVYTTGRLTNFEDAVKMQNQVRLEGIKDAFVVPYLNGNRISIKEAKELTK